MVNIEAIESPDGLIKLEQIWNSLLAKTNIEHPFLTFEWISCWWKSYGDGDKPLVLVAREEGEVVGIVPLMKTMIVHRGFRLKAITFIANYHTNRAGFILNKNKKETLSAMLEYIRKTHSYADLYLIRYLEKGSDDEILLSNVLKEMQMGYITMPCLLSPYVKIDQCWDNYFQVRSSNFREKYKRLNNRFKKMGNFEILKYTNAEIEKAINELLCVSKKTWQYDNGSAIASKDANIAFYSSFAKSAAIHEWLNLWILKISGKPIAFIYNLVYKGKLFLIKLGYDKEYAKDSPGDFLNGIVLKDCFERGISEYELLGLNDQYKMRLTSLCKAHVRYLVFGDTFSGILLRIAELFIVPVLRNLRSVLVLQN